MIGPALLGAFAVEEIVKWYGEVGKAREVMEGAALAAKELQLRIHQNTSEIEELARKNLDYARSEIKVFEADIAILKSRNAELKSEHDFMESRDASLGLFTMAYEKVTGKLHEVEESDKQIIEFEKTLASLRKIMGEDEVKARKEAAAELKKQLEEEKRMAEFRYHEGVQAAEAFIRSQAAIGKEAKKEAEEAEHLKQAWWEYSEGLKLPKENTEKFLADMEAMDKALGLLPPTLQVMVPKIQDAFAKIALAEDQYAGRVDKDTIQTIHDHERATEAHIRRTLEEARLLAQQTGNWQAYAAATAKANELITQALEDQTAAEQGALAATAQRLAGTLGLEKEFIIAEAAYYIPKDRALGFEALGMGDFWGAANYFAGAAEWGIAAGKAVSGIVGGGGSGGGSRSSRAAVVVAWEEAARWALS